MAGDPNPRHILRVGAGLFQHAGNDRAVGLPHFFHVPFHKPGLRCDGSRGNNGFADFLSGAVKQCRFGRCAAVIQSDKIMHDVSAPFSG